MQVSVIVPCRNEASHIEAFLDSALAQQLPMPDDVLEVVVADGMSDDGTRALLDKRSSADKRLWVVDNPAGITSTALNLATVRASGEIVVRMDVHTVYASDYLRECVQALCDTGAVCVGGAWRPVGRGWPQQAIALAFSSRFGSGGAASRRIDYSGPVDTVYLGAWRRDDLLRFGGFDESLVRNQDDELNLRIVRAGGTVWQSASIRSEYEPRASFLALFRQFHQYGYWKVPVIRKHRLPASPRHLAPFFFVVLLMGLVLLAPWWSLASGTLVGLLSAYAVTALCNAAALARAPHRLRDTLGIAWAFACMHFGYGLGFGRALLDVVVLRRAPGEAATRLTR